MRLNRLALIRYGRFQDFTLDFGEVPQAGPDVAVVYGANEAGKSTAFMAWLDFLFGFQGASPYAFRFDRRDLLVGAEMETPDGPQTLRRSTTAAGSLTDANGHVIAEHRMAGWLFGLDREAYRTRFSLNDIILREGGREISQAQGDLGQLLHAGASGLSGLSKALTAIEDEVAAFHRKGGRKTVANEGRNRLKELEAELRTVRLDPRSFDRLSKARDDGEVAFHQAHQALAAARRALKLREAADQRREVAGAIETLRAALATCPTGPDLPAGAVARVARAAQKCISANEAAAKAQADAHAATERLAALDGDPDGQQVAAHLDAIEAAVFGDGEQLLPRVQTAHADLAKRRGERSALLAAMAELAERLAGRGPAPREIVLPKALLAVLRRGADEVRTARAALDGEVGARSNAEADHGDPIEPPVGLDPLEDAVQTWHRNPNAFEEAVRAARSADAVVADLTAGLPPDWRAVAEAGLPELAEIEAVADCVRVAETRRDAQADLVRDAGREREAAYSARDTLAGRSDVVLDAQLLESRDRRDKAWITHRAALDAGTADLFARAMYDDDVVLKRHAATAEGRLRFARACEEVATRQALHEQKAAALAAAEGELGAARDAAATMAVGLGLPPSAPAKALRQRRDRLEEALQAARRAEDARAAAKALQEVRAAQLDALREALGPDGAFLLDAHLPAAAERALGVLRNRKASADAWRETRRTLDRMRASEARAAQLLADLERGLAARLDGLWCAGFDAGHLLVSLPDLEALAELDDRRLQLDRRITTMEDALATFEPMATPLRALLDLPDAVPPFELIAAARRRAEEAAETARAGAAEKDALAQAERIVRDAAVDRASGRVDIARILVGQGIDADGDPVETVDLLSRRDDFRRRLADAESAYAAAGRDFDPTALAAEEAERDSVRTDALREAVEGAATLRDEALECRSQARHALDSALAGEGSVTPDQERAALVEAMRQSGREALVRQFGLLAARSALRRFRQSHRGEMIEATERSFAQITGGRWPRLDIQAQGTTERLVGIRNGEPVAVNAMSTGTQGQLYLALRIAGHSAFLAERGPLPFITDDVHETFDDERARAALELAATMGERGQTILFTHHRHLVDLARAAIPSVKILELA